MSVYLPTDTLIDLHRHLDGNVRLSTILDLADKNKIALPTNNIESLATHVHIKDKTTSLVAFLNKLDIGVSVLSSLDDCRRVAYENVIDAVAEDLAYAELRFSPYYMAKTHNLPLYGVVEAVIDGVKTANLDTHYNAKLIGILSRTFGVDACFVELGAILGHKDSIIALDLAGDELGFPAELFQSHFDKARNAGLHVTVHAGEADGPESIYNAINLLGATRIGHAINAYKDPKLMTYMAKNKIGIESCILSNYQTCSFTDIKNHPVKTFLEYDIPVCLNTDDPGISNNTLSGEYNLARDVLSLSEKDILKLQDNSIDMTFLSHEEKKRLRQKP